MLRARVWCGVVCDYGYSIRVLLIGCRAAAQLRDGITMACGALRSQNYHICSFARGFELTVNKLDGVNVNGALSRAAAPIVARLVGRCRHHHLGHAVQQRMHVQAVVIGAGVVGLATARALARRGREVLILESERRVGSGTSSRNSEVVHAGIYYPAGSLKATACVAGRRMLQAYCHDHDVPLARVGKLIVATSEEEVCELPRIRNQATQNGLTEPQEALRVLSADEVRSLEPEVQCLGALLSPSTSIMDSHALMLALQADAEACGATVSFSSRVVGGDVNASSGARGVADARIRLRVMVPTHQPPRSREGGGGGSRKWGQL